MRNRVGNVFACLAVALAAAAVAQHRGCTLPDIVTPKAESLHLVIVSETGNPTAELRALFVALRNADLGKHVLDILDPDQIPPYLKDTLEAPLSLTPPPSLVLIDRDNDVAVYSRPLLSQETVATVLATVKEHSR